MQGAFPSFGMTDLAMFLISTVEMLKVTDVVFEEAVSMLDFMVDEVASVTDVVFEEAAFFAEFLDEAAGVMANILFNATTSVTEF